MDFIAQSSMVNHGEERKDGIRGARASRMCKMESLYTERISSGQDREEMSESGEA